jgi:hypothetical protein
MAWAVIRVRSWLGGLGVAGVVAVGVIVGGTGAAQELELVAGGLVQPVMVIAPPGDPRLFVVERSGRVRIVTADGQLAPLPFLDLTDQHQADADGQGLLGLAFDPDFTSNGRFFLYQAGPVQADAPLAKRLLWRAAAMVSEMAVTASDPDRAAPTPRRTILRLDLAADSRPGGALAMMRGGKLAIGVGRGTAGADAVDGLGAVLSFDRARGQTGVLAAGLEDPRWCSVDEGGAGVLFCLDAERRRLALIVDGAEPPVIAEIALDAGCSGPDCAPIGGHVHRGRSLPDLIGSYLFARADHGLMVARPPDGKRTDWAVEPLEVAAWPSDQTVSALGQDSQGTTYILTTSRLYRLR